jgi:hypothetical protein
MLLLAGGGRPLLVTMTSVLSARQNRLHEVEAKAASLETQMSMRQSMESEERKCVRGRAMERHGLCACVAMGS